MLSKFTNPELVDRATYGTGFQPVTLVKGKYFIHATQTPCSDHITDIHMYPSTKMDFIKYDGTLNRQRKQRYLFSFDSAKTRELVLNNIKYLRLIEQANNLKPTKITKVGDFNLLAEPDREISRTTFNLSWFLKFFRIAQVTRVPSFTHVFGEFSSWLMFSGQLHNVDKECNYVHGWDHPGAGNHSNNGVNYTNYMVRKIFELNTNKEKIPTYEQIPLEKAREHFTRTKNLLPLYEEFLSNKDDNLKVIPQ